jgi:hypothetical protein
MTKSSSKLCPSALLLALVGLFFAFTSDAKQNAKQAQVDQTPPLEVRVTKLLQWMNGCLSVSIDRINRSDATLYLPVRGIYLDSSVSRSPNEPKERNEQNWINLYGVFDIVSFDATPLLPGTTRHDEICYIRPTVLVTNLKEKTIRRIPIRGKLRIDAYYFLTMEDWLTNKRQHYGTSNVPPDELVKTGHLEPQVATAEATIPCYDAGCKPGCDNPPVVLDGEKAFLFTPSDAQWEAHGKAVSEELAQKYPSCAETLEPK